MEIGYLPHQSPVHRLNPLTKFTWLCVLGVLSFILQRPSELGAVLVGVGVLAMIARILLPWLRFIRVAMLPALVITVVNVLMSPYHGERMVFASYTGTNDIVLHYELGVFSFTVTTFGLQKGILLGFRWLSLIAPAGVFVYTTKPEDFAATLSRLRVPYSISFAIGAALRLIPALVEDMQTVLAAQRARGLDWDRRLMGRARALRILVFPVVACEIRRAVEMAAAMEARAYGATTTRTVCYPVNFSRRDIYWVATAGLMLAFGVLDRIGMR